MCSSNMILLWNDAKDIVFQVPILSEGLPGAYSTWGLAQSVMVFITVVVHIPGNVVNSHMKMLDMEAILYSVDYQGIIMTCITI